LPLPSCGTSALASRGWPACSRRAASLAGRPFPVVLRPTFPALLSLIAGRAVTRRPVTRRPVTRRATAGRAVGPVLVFLVSVRYVLVFRVHGLRLLVFVFGLPGWLTGFEQGLRSVVQRPGDRLNPVVDRCLGRGLPGVRQVTLQCAGDLPELGR
jgi:hypothetical protein